MTSVLPPGSSTAGVALEKVDVTGGSVFSERFLASAVAPLLAARDTTVGSVEAAAAAAAANLEAAHAVSLVDVTIDTTGATVDGAIPARAAVTLGAPLSTSFQYGLQVVNNDLPELVYSRSVPNAAGNGECFSIGGSVAPLASQANVGVSVELPVRGLAHTVQSFQLHVNANQGDARPIAEKSARGKLGVSREFGSLRASLGVGILQLNMLAVPGKTAPGVYVLHLGGTLEALVDAEAVYTHPNITVSAVLSLVNAVGAGGNAKYVELGVSSVVQWLPILPLLLSWNGCASVVVPLSGDVHPLRRLSLSALPWRYLTVPLFLRPDQRVLPETVGHTAALTGVAAGVFLPSSTLAMASVFADVGVVLPGSMDFSGKPVVEYGVGVAHLGAGNAAAVWRLGSSSPLLRLNAVLLGSL